MFVSAAFSLHSYLWTERGQVSCHSTPAKTTDLRSQDRVSSPPGDDSVCAGVPGLALQSVEVLLTSQDPCTS